MRSPRSSPRINLRFKNLEIMDDVELTANKDGLDLQTWLRRLALREVQYQKVRPLLLHEAVERLVTIQAILEQLVAPSVVTLAQKTARTRISKLNLQPDQLK